MNALIIGAAGFVGSYLIEHLKNSYKWNLSVTKLPHEVLDTTDANVFNLDILEKASIITLLNETKPDYIFHLAAQSSISVSWKNPALTVDININGTLNVLDAIRETRLNPRILLIGSGEEYGYITADEVPIKENTNTRPGNIYAATKACQNMIGHIYARAYNMDIMMVRAFNHIGPGQAPLFVVSDFCKQVAEIEKGLRNPVIKVGNLSAKRDFTDVRDVVAAYGLLMIKGQQGETYNVGSGNAVEIKTILDLILTFSKKEITVEVDSDRLRPADVPIIEADIQKLVAATNWQYTIPLEQTIEETLNYWRV